MAIVSFPPIENSDENGLVAIGGDLEISSLILAYGKGIFPWPISDQFPLAWFSPDPRGLLYYKDLKVPKRLKKYLKAHPYTIKTNRNFETVILNCARVARKNQDGTWITQEIIEAYINLHRAGFAYSIEVYEEDQIIAGIYGTLIRGHASGESMYTTRDHASKLALIVLLEVLHQAGLKFLDTQMVTPVVESLGGVQIPRNVFLSKVNLSPAKTLEDVFHSKETIQRSFYQHWFE